MLTNSRNLRVWAWPAPCDLRKSYDSLAAIVTQKMAREVLTGDLFLFVNRRQNRAKVLMWDGTGLCIYMKRLEKGRFAKLWQRGRHKPRGLLMTCSELSLFLEGCHLVSKGPLSPDDMTASILAKGPASMI